MADDAFAEDGSCETFGTANLIGGAFSIANRRATRQNP